MEASDAGLIGIIIFLAQLVGKLVEKLVDKFLKDRADSSPSSAGMSEQDIKRLVEWHNVKDQDGVFVWYFPRSALEKRFDDIMIVLRDVRDRQQEFTNDIINELRKK